MLQGMKGPGEGNREKLAKTLTGTCTVGGDQSPSAADDAGHDMALLCRGEARTVSPLINHSARGSANFKCTWWSRAHRQPLQPHAVHPWSSWTCRVEDGGWMGKRER